MKTKMQEFVDYAMGIVEDNERFGKAEKLFLQVGHLANPDDIVMTIIINPKHIKNHVGWMRRHYDQNLERHVGSTHMKVVEYS